MLTCDLHPLNYLELTPVRDIASTFHTARQLIDKCHFCEQNVLIYERDFAFQGKKQCLDMAMFLCLRKGAMLLARQ